MGDRGKTVEGRNMESVNRGARDTLIKVRDGRQALRLSSVELTAGFD